MRRPALPPLSFPSYGYLLRSLRRMLVILSLRAHPLGPAAARRTH